MTPSARSDISLFLTNLRLLDLDQLPDWPHISIQTFDTKNARHGQKLRIRCAEWALYRLFERWDRLCGIREMESRLRPFFPPLEPLQSLNLRAALFRCLSDLKKQGILSRDVLLRKTMLDECKGDRFEELLYSFSTLVLKKTLTAKESKGQERTIARRLGPTASLLDGDRDLVEALILAHKASLGRRLERRAQQLQAYESFGQLLRTEELSLTQRKEAVGDHRGDEATATGCSNIELKSLKQRVQDGWCGDQRWLQVIFDGDPAHESEPILDMSFADVWNAVNAHQLHTMGQEREVSLLRELDMRVQRQRDRSTLLSRLERDIECRRRPSKKAEDQMQEAQKDRGGLDLTFEDHKRLLFKSSGASFECHSQPPPSLSRKTHPYDEMMICLEAELAAIDGGAHAKARGNSQWKISGIKSSERWPSQMTVAVVRHEEDDILSGKTLATRDVEESVPPQSTELRALAESSSTIPMAPSQILARTDEELSPSRIPACLPGNVDTLAEEGSDSGPTTTRSASAATSTLHERTLASMANAKTSSSAITGAALASTSISRAVLSLKARPASPSPMTPPERNRSNAVLTPESPAATTRPHQRPNLGALAPSPILNEFPATPQRRLRLSSHNQDDASEASSAATTPREELFSEEADYASVFRSRPRIQTTMATSPERSICNLESSGDEDAARQGALPRGTRETTGRLRESNF